jgi:tellurite methyltransferase
MSTGYDEKYRNTTSCWGRKPSQMCLTVLELMPPERPLRLLDIGCGEGQNAVFFARNGYEVSAFDLSSVGVEKTLRAAEHAKVVVNAFQADLLTFRLSEEYDILFSSGTLHYTPEPLRQEIFGNYKGHTVSGGINAFSILVKKPFIAKAPDSDASAQHFVSGELFTHYHDWKIELCNEAIFDCMSGGVPHQHASNRMIARRMF